MQITDIRIAGFDFTIREEDIAAGMYSTGAMGQCNTIAQDIVIGKFMKRDQKIVTLLHEIIHCVCELYNIPLDEEKEEFIIDGIARGFFQVLKDNEQLIDYLKDTFEK